MKKEIEGVMHLTLSDVAKEIDRTPTTIKRWYEFYEKMPKEEQDTFPELPEMMQKGNKKWYYIKEEDIPKLIKFRDSIGYGDLSYYYNKYVKQNKEG